MGLAFFVIGWFLVTFFVYKSMNNDYFAAMIISVFYPFIAFKLILKQGWLKYWNKSNDRKISVVSEAIRKEKAAEENLKE